MTVTLIRPNRALKLSSHYTLTSVGLQVSGRPTFDEHEEIGEALKYFHRVSGFALGDWLRYGETRADWQGQIDQLVDASGMSEKTLKNVRAIAGIDPSRRRDDVDFSTHSEVASLAPDEQSEWLDQAATHGWTKNELRKNIRASKRARIIEGQAVLKGQYRVIYADPPWPYGDRPPSGSGADSHYPNMSIADICALPIAAHTTEDAVLFLWTTAPFILANPGPREVIEAWGFRAKTGRVWDKVRHGFGHYVEVRHEHLIIATRGSCLPDRPTPMLPSVVTERRSDTHSAKPESFRADIERLYDGPYLELFGRKKATGWTVFGNDARLWGSEK
jgi:N6-adenosine-specific RNA methylase IME4